ncbi:hypothetical protein HPB50_028012 [Hyalomma asiaticum]|nr:hypothetical protein HPB50_028012 [Hyalomma asiaticum]
MKITCCLSTSTSALLAERSTTWPSHMFLRIAAIVPKVKTRCGRTSQSPKQALKRRFTAGRLRENEEHGMARVEALKRGGSSKRQHRFAQVKTTIFGIWSNKIDKGLEFRVGTTDIILLSSLLLLLLLEKPMLHQRHSHGGKDDKDNMRHSGVSSGNVKGLQEGQLCTVNIVFPPVLLLLQEPALCGWRCRGLATEKVTIGIRVILEEQQRQFIHNDEIIHTQCRNSLKQPLEFLLLEAAGSSGDYNEASMSSVDGIFTRCRQVQSGVGLRWTMRDPCSCDTANV